MSKSRFSFGEEAPSTVLAENDFYKRNAAAPIVYDFGPSLTRQEMAEDCDINVIMERYQLSGDLPRTQVEPHYADYSDVPDLMTAMDVLSQAQAAFMSLPAKVRREFENDPVQFVEFAGDPDNLDQMRLWGLAPPAPEKPPEVASPPASGSEAPPAPPVTGEGPKPA